MTIDKDAVQVRAVGALLAMPLVIPDYQRPYAWSPQMALRLLDDVMEASQGRMRDDSYVLGSVILHRDDDEKLNVVDGQQRLITLRLLQDCLGEGPPLLSDDPGDSPVMLAWAALRRRTRDMTVLERDRLLCFAEERCEVFVVTTDDVDEAFRVFDSQNYRGVSLKPHDLLKAYHLREMRSESSATQAAVVEGWETAGDAALDRLFSTYLYRILMWSRGRAAPGFTISDVGAFKGTDARMAALPSARYHRLAQAAVPLLEAMSPTQSDADRRRIQRTRFQIDAPIPAGRGFFEMVGFMLEELVRIRKESFADGREQFCSAVEDGLEERPRQSRYRKVSELYLAGVLYYTNRFGDDEIEQVRRVLFAWAYSRRVQLLRVQAASVDNLARGADGPGAFEQIRNAIDSREVTGLMPVDLKPYREGHEPELLTQITGSATS